MIVSIRVLLLHTIMCARLDQACFYAAAIMPSVRKRRHTIEL